jgi:hypothetical protein
MQELDARDLKKRIVDQIELIQEMTWDGQDTAEAKETLRALQHTLEASNDYPTVETLGREDL